MLHLSVAYPAEYHLVEPLAEGKWEISATDQALQSFPERETGKGGGEGDPHLLLAFVV